MAPTRGIVKAVNIAAQAFLRTVSKIVGGDVVRDAITFFQAFDGMEEGFRERAAHVLELLTHAETAFILVAAPRREVVEEASFFAEKLGEADIPVRALIVNRMHPKFSDASPDAMRERSRTLEGTDLGGLYGNLADFLTVASREEAHVAGLAERVAPAPVVRVPFLQTDVHDLDGLGQVARYLFGSAPAAARQ
jgi:anion-transporting  ArsA/GET3 family ATPase